MNRALYIGATSMIANQKRMDVVSNNLANVNTSGYKKDMSIHQSFNEVLLAKKSKIPEVYNRGERGFNFINNGNHYLASVNKGYFTVEVIGSNDIVGRKSFEKELKFSVDNEGYLKTFYNTSKGNRYDYESYILDNSGNRIQVGVGADGAAIEDALRNAVYDPMPYVVGTLSRGVRFKKIATDFSQASLIDTGLETDVALTDSGFFKVLDENGDIYYTRNGSFGVEGGFLRDHDGRFVLVDGAPLEIPEEGYNSFDILENGGIMINEESVGTLDVVDIDNPELLRKVGYNLYEVIKPDRIIGERGEVLGAEVNEILYQGRIVQGYLENSNVNAVSSMVEMIALQRDYDSAQKIIHTSDQMLEKSNELGRI